MKFNLFYLKILLFCLTENMLRFYFHWTYESLRSKGDIKGDILNKTVSSTKLLAQLNCYRNETVTATKLLVQRNC